MVSSESAPPDQEVDAPRPLIHPSRAEQEPEGRGREHALYPTLLPALIPNPPLSQLPCGNPTADGSSDRLVARAADAVRPHHPWENTDGRPMPVAEAGTSAPAHESAPVPTPRGAGAPLPPQHQLQPGKPGSILVARARRFQKPLRFTIHLNPRIARERQLAADQNV